MVYVLLLLLRAFVVLCACARSIVSMSLLNYYSTAADYGVATRVIASFTNLESTPGCPQGIKADVMDPVPMGLHWIFSGFLLV